MPEGFHYGYNYQVGTIKVNRDRDIVSDFDLKWHGAEILSKADPDIIEKAMLNLSAECMYLNSFSHEETLKTAVNSIAKKGILIVKKDSYSRAAMVANNVMVDNEIGKLFEKELTHKMIDMKNKFEILNLSDRILHDKIRIEKILKLITGKEIEIVIVDFRDKSLKGLHEDGKIMVQKSEFGEMLATALHELTHYLGHSNHSLAFYEIFTDLVAKAFEIIAV